MYSHQGQIFNVIWVHLGTIIQAFKSQWKSIRHLEHSSKKPHRGKKYHILTEVYPAQREKETEHRDSIPPEY